MSNEELKQLAHSLIAEKLQNKDEVQMEWAVHELIKARGKIHGAGVDFYKLCAHEHCYRIVKSVVDKYEGESEPEDQMLLEGFKYVQSAYTIDRDGERALVPIEQLKDDELLVRADLFDTQAKAMQAHAKELRLYVSERALRKTA